MQVRPYHSHIQPLKMKVVEPFREIGKLFIVFGVLLAAVGALLLVGGKLPFRLGRLPGDIVYEGKNSAFYFPIVTCILLSAVLSGILWLVGQIRK